MAKDNLTKKRKASTSEEGAEKIKKVKKVPADTVELLARKRKASENTAPPKAKKSKKPSEESTEAVESPTKPIKETNGKTAKPKKGKKSAKIDPEPVEETEEIPNEEDEDIFSESEESEVDDQTEALLEGFQSDGDDEDALIEDGLPAGQAVPARKELSKKQEKALKKIADAKDKNEKPGVIYIGRIPHGFYENEMKSYFKQFGDILKLRLSRNRRTGASKHYAWIQFESGTVAEIVAKTMNNYLMFGHILKVKLVPEEQVPKDLFVGANRRFKKVPWNKMAGRQLEQGQSEQKWDERVEREESRRVKKAAKLKEIGYEFDAPKVKTTKEIVSRAAELKAAPETLVIEAAPSTETSKPKKEKKVKAEAVSEVATAAEVKPKVKKSKKQKVGA